MCHGPFPGTSPGQKGNAGFRRVAQESNEVHGSRAAAACEAALGMCPRQPLPSTPALLTCDRPAKLAQVSMADDAAAQPDLESEEEDGDYVPVDDDENAAEDDAYEALHGGEDPEDPGARARARRACAEPCARARARSRTQARTRQPAQPGWR